MTETVIKSRTAKMVLTVITRGRYEKESLLMKMNAFLLNESITQEEYDALEAMLV